MRRLYNSAIARIAPTALALALAFLAFAPHTWFHG
jgi:hypothetical protein